MSVYIVQSLGILDTRNRPKHHETSCKAQFIQVVKSCLLDYPWPFDSLTVLRALVVPASHRIRQFRCPSLRRHLLCSSGADTVHRTDSPRPGAAHSDPSVHVSASLVMFTGVRFTCGNWPCQRGGLVDRILKHSLVCRDILVDKCRWNVEVFETTRRRGCIQHGLSPACPLLSPVLLSMNSDQCQKVDLQAWFILLCRGPSRSKGKFIVLSHAGLGHLPNPFQQCSFIRAE